MTTIIDTHIFLWLIYDIKRIHKKYIKYLEDPNNSIYLSSISIAEIMIKKSIGTLDIKCDLLAICKKMDIAILDFDAKSALLLASLPFHHKDPFDRMIIAQAQTHHYDIISVDKKFSKYAINLL